MYGELNLIQKKVCTDIKSYKDNRKKFYSKKLRKKDLLLKLKAAIRDTFTISYYFPRTILIQVQFLSQQHSQPVFSKIPCQWSVKQLDTSQAQTIG